MKHRSLFLLALAIPAMALAAPQPTKSAEIFKRQAASSTISIPPPPAESTGCVLHIDHYHCEGPASAAMAASGTITIPAPPAESTGCVLHDDHYHCEGPASGHSADGDAHDHDHDHDHDHAVSGSVSIPPPPAESTGCVLHDDHYHCAGPASSAVASQARDTVSTSAPVLSSSSIAASASAAAAQSSGAAMPGLALPSTVTFGLALSAAGVVAGVGHLLV